MNPPRAAWFNPSPATLAVPERPQDPPPPRTCTHTHARTHALRTRHHTCRSANAGTGIFLSRMPFGERGRDPSCLAAAEGVRGRAVDVPPEIRQPSHRVLKHGERAQRTMSGDGGVQSEGSYHPPSVVMIGLRLFSFLRQLIRLFSLVSVKTNHKKKEGHL